MTESTSRSRWTRPRSWIAWVILPLAVGILLSLFIPRPVVGVIRLSDAIYTLTAQDLVKQIQYAADEPRVRAVVLILDSPGGTVADTETVYQELSRLRAKKPVVSSVGSMAASGAYYLAVGTDYIIANPTSDVGNIGVIGFMPTSPVVFEDTLSTGPYKLWGEPRDRFQREMEMIKKGFFQAVRLGRGEALKAPDEVILSGQIWPGTSALRLGIIDQLGSQSDAYVKAAQMARIANYEVADLRELSGINDTIPQAYGQSPDGKPAERWSPQEAGLYLLYVPPAEVKP